MKLFNVLVFSCLSTVAAFVPSANKSLANSSSLKMTASALVEPSKRDEKYSGNIAQYLVDLHDNKATFDFCGGLMFQLVLSEKLRDYLLATEKQPIVSDASKPRMHQLDNYSQNDAADNIQIFHGREIRSVPDAAGGMGFVLQLSLANEKDPQGWTDAEIAGYNGWSHDASRDWRTGERLEQEGFAGFVNTFGPKSFALHHRFYLHYDSGNRLWLSAEDGCEGTPGVANPVQSFLRKLL